MGEHTKGPWKVNAEDTSVYTENGQMHVADVRGWGTLRYKRSGEAEYLANARLIAAAPELLEALERVVKLDAHGCLTRDCPHKTGRECAEELATVLAEMIDRARYAIEKARGEG